MKHMKYVMLILFLFQFNLILSSDAIKQKDVSLCLEESSGIIDKAFYYALIVPLDFAYYNIGGDVALTKMIYSRIPSNNYKNLSLLKIRKAVADMRNNLNCYEPKVGRVCFQDIAQKLLNSNETIKFLNDLNLFIKDLKSNPKKAGNLWDFALKHPVINGNKQKAIEWLAVLLQSNRPSYFIDAINPALPAYNVLKETLELLAHKKITPNLKLYPSPIDSPNQKPDKFYVMALLGQQLLKNGHDRRLAFAAPYMMNLAYERYQNDLGIDLSNQEKEWIEKDSYLGFLGASFGTLQKDEAFSKIPTLENYQKTFRTSESQIISNGFSIIGN